jgi:hypothetical protein
VVEVEPHRACLVHLTGSDRATYVSGLAPGSDLDHRGTHVVVRRLVDSLVTGYFSRPGWPTGALRAPNQVFSGTCATFARPIAVVG